MSGSHTILSVNRGFTEITGGDLKEGEMVITGAAGQQGQQGQRGGGQGQNRGPRIL